ncbi:hypothetical protein C0993_002466 [Termitomyces sp. T159_Od127]|nr:hypothetical protein C0993_002466 [Termitomyces sp. T159_Od127]
MKEALTANQLNDTTQKTTPDGATVRNHPIATHPPDGDKNERSPPEPGDSRQAIPAGTDNVKNKNGAQQTSSNKADVSAVDQQTDELTDRDADGDFETDTLCGSHQEDQRDDHDATDTLCGSHQEDQEDDDDAYVPSDSDSSDSAGENSDIEQSNIANDANRFMAQYDPGTSNGAVLLKKIREELQKAFMGYAIVYATSDDQFGCGPRIRRNVVNPRVPNDKALDLFYRATHRGATLDTMGVQHAITIGAHPRSLTRPLTKDPSKARLVKYDSLLHGKVYDEEKLNDTGLASRIPILLDGGHRLDLMQKRIYNETLLLMEQASFQLEAHRLGGTSPNSTFVRTWRARYDAALNTAKEGAWLARFYNMKIISRSRFRPQLLLLLCANTPTHRISDSEITHLLMISDILNNPHMNQSNALNYYLRYQLNPTDSMNARIRGALSDERVTLALANLLRIDYFRTQPSAIWNINQLYKWQRAALSIMTPYIEWTALLFNILASTNPLALTEPYPTDNESLINDTWKYRLNANLELFDLLPFPLRDVYLDIFDSEFFHIVFNTWHEHLNDLAYWYGIDLAQESPAVSTRYNNAWLSYEDQLLAKLGKWINNRLTQIGDDPALVQILKLMPDRLLWIIKAQVVSGFRLPALSTKTGILVPLQLNPLLNAFANIEESLIMVIGQFDSMAAYELRSDRHHNTENCTYLDLIEAVHIRVRHDEPTTFELRRAVCHFVGVLIRNRRSGFQTMRALNGGNSTHAEKPPFYIPLIIKGRKKEPRIIRAIEVISAITKDFCAKGLTGIPEDKWKALQGGKDCVPTSRTLLVRALTKTCSPWMTSPYARTGNHNRSNYLATISSWLFLSTHAVSSSLTEPEYKEVGYEARYWRDPSAYQVLCDITAFRYDGNPDSIGFKAWHLVLKPPSTTPVSSQLATEPSFKAIRHGNLSSASSFINDVYKYLHRSQLFSLDVSRQTAEHTLTVRARNFMDSVVEFVKDGLVDFHQDIVPVPPSNNSELNAQRRLAICEGLVIPPYQNLYVPTNTEQINHFSRDNLQKLSDRAENSSDAKIAEKVLAVGNAKSGRKRGRKDAEDGSPDKAQRGAAVSRFIDLRTKQATVRKSRSKKPDANAPGKFHFFRSPLVTDFQSKAPAPHQSM